MRTKLILGSVVAATLSLAAVPSTYAAAPVGPQASTCETRSTMIDATGVSIIAVTPNCTPDAIEQHESFVSQAYAWFFGRRAPAVPAPTPAPAPTATGLTCSVYVDGTGRMKEVGITLRSDTNMEVDGELAVTAEGKGKSRFRQGLDEPVKLVKGKAQDFTLATTNLAKGARLAGYLTTEDGDRVDCDIPR